MAEDFEKDQDDEFANEFDFVDESVDSKGSSGGGGDASGGNAAAPQKPTASLVKILVSAVLVLVVGYVATNFMFSGDKESAPVEPPPAGETSELPVPSPVPAPAPAPAQPLPTAQPAPSMDELEQAFAGQGSMQDPLTAAVPAKSFEQVQAELKTANQSSASTSAVNALQGRLDSLSEEMTGNVNQITQLQAAISNLATTVENLNRSISAMDNRVLGLTETVDGLSQDLANVKRVITAEDLDLTMPAQIQSNTSKKTNKPLTSSGPSYTVHAVIPGRAWLKSSGGQIITVTEGDKIGDYGTVAVIDAANGVVRTSSGITFK